MELLIPQYALVKLFAAVVAGGLIGSEREYRNETAGFRTITLICFSACLFTMLSIAIGSNSPDRIAANIVTGIGFLGAGAIFKEGDKVSGLTTAATIWVSAAIGMCIGRGYLGLAAVSTALILAILMILSYVERVIDDLNEMHQYRISCKYSEDMLFKYQRLFTQHGLKAMKGKLSRKGDTFTGSWTVIGKHKKHQDFVTALVRDSDVIDFEF